jgi:hypothetical protein
MRCDLQAMEWIGEIRNPGQITNPGSSARGCYAALFRSGQRDRGEELNGTIS